MLRRQFSDHHELLPCPSPARYMHPCCCSLAAPPLQMPACSNPMTVRHTTASVPMASYWSKACTAQYNRPMWQLQLANYGSCIFAVSAFSHCIMTCAAARTHRSTDDRGTACCGADVCCRLSRLELLLCTAGGGICIGRGQARRSGCGRSWVCSAGWCAWAALRA